MSMFNIKSIVSPIDSSNLSFKSENILVPSKKKIEKEKILKQTRISHVPAIKTISLSSIDSISSQNFLYSNSFMIVCQENNSKSSQTTLPSINTNMNKHIQSIIRNYPSINLRRQTIPIFPKPKTNFINNMNKKTFAFANNDNKTRYLKKFQFDSINYGDLSKLKK